MENPPVPHCPKTFFQLDLQTFPPEPNRLPAMIESFIEAGYDGLLLDFGELFPWSTDERFRGEEAYPEEVIGGLDEIAVKKGFEIIPLFEYFSSLDYMLCQPAYRHLSVEGSYPVLLNPFAPGAKGFVESLFEDIVSLLPGVKRVHLGGSIPLLQIIREEQADEFFEQFFYPLVRYIRENDCVPMLDETFFAGVKRPEDQEDVPLFEPVFSEYPAVSAWNTPGPFFSFRLHFTETSGGSTGMQLRERLERIAQAAGRQNRGKKLESFLVTGAGLRQAFLFQEALDTVFSRAGTGKTGALSGDNREYVSRFEELESLWQAFRQKLIPLWGEIAGARELVVSATLDGCRRPATVNSCGEALRKAEAFFAGLEEKASEIRERSAGMVNSTRVEKMLRTKIEPLREEIVLLRARMRQLGQD